MAIEKGQITDVWDGLASCFDRTDLENAGYAPAVENLKVVWPDLYRIIQNELPKKGGINYRVCDFGCGTGKLAEAISSLGASVYGCDCSKEMIARARHSTQGNVVYGVGSHGFVRHYAPFDLITAIMVFQFMNDWNKALDVLIDCLAKDGILFWAIHNDEYVQHGIQYGSRFRNSIRQDYPGECEILIDSAWVKMNSHSYKWYDNTLTKKGLTCLGYSVKDGASNQSAISKYCIAWYKKCAEK